MMRIFSGLACRSLLRSERVTREGHPTYRCSSNAVGELPFLRGIRAALERERAQAVLRYEASQFRKAALRGCN